MDKKKRITLALMCFSLFFGAGNLIFPPQLAVEAGRDAFTALAGFYLSAIGLPVLGLLAVARSEGVENLASRVSQLFSKVFITIIYLSIGPFLAIPRTASTSFELAGSFLPENLRSTGLLVYSIIFFTIASIAALKPEKLTRFLGRILCPTLIILILVVFIGSLTLAGGGTDVEHGMENAFLTGFISGYQTMDAVAALAFGLIIMLNVRAMGAEGRKEELKEESIASLLAGVIFILVYTIIAVIGIIASRYYPESTNGAEVLQRITTLVFGKAGRVILSAVFIIACLNTAIGLLSSCAEYFNMNFPLLSYRKWLIVFALVSMALSNLGLDLILSLSLPLLKLLYPVTIVLIVLALIPTFDNGCWSYRLSTAAALLFSALELFVPFSGNYIPLSSYSLGWVIPAFSAAAIGYAADRKGLPWKV